MHNNLKISEVLTIAKDYLWEPRKNEHLGSSDFICHAIEDAYKAGLITQEEKKYTISYIMAKIAPSNTLNTYLKLYNLPTLSEEYVKHRNKWLNEQITQLQSQGN